eukprot:scaffold292164_cov28-Tisochrysis_lutea.AAC.1
MEKLRRMEGADKERRVRGRPAARSFEALGGCPEAERGILERLGAECTGGSKGGEPGPQGSSRGTGASSAGEWQLQSQDCKRRRMESEEVSSDVAPFNVIRQRLRATRPRHGCSEPSSLEERR